MNLFSILSQSASGLSAHQGSAATASHNLANVNTPGYSRQSAELATNLPAEAEANAYIGRGVTLQTVSQARDRFLEAQIPANLDAAASADTESTALAAVSVLDPEAQNGLGSALSSYFSALRALSQNPGSAVLRESAVSASTTLARTFQSTAGAIKDAQDGLDSQIAGQVTQVNNLAVQVAALNNQIRTARASGGEPNDLLDRRQNLQDQLATLVGAQPVPDDKGNVNLVLAGGFALVNEDKAATLSVVPDPANGGHLALQAIAFDGSGPGPVGAAGGNLGGAIAARDGALANALNSLDTLAFDFANATNAVHATGLALDGSTGRTLFDVPPTSAGAASKIAVNAQVAADPNLLAAATIPNSPGDATNAMLLIGVEQTTLSTGQNAAAALSQVTTDFGATAQRAASMSEQEQAVGAQLDKMRQSVSGVSIDDEMVKLTQAQRAYEAVTKVITAADAMLQDLMNIT